jgi:hypothetical protein
MATSTSRQALEEAVAQRHPAVHPFSDPRVPQEAAAPSEVSQ